MAIKIDRESGLIACGPFSFKLQELFRAKVYNRPERRLQSFDLSEIGQVFEGEGRLRAVLKSPACGLAAPVAISWDGSYLSVSFNSGEIVESYGTGYRLMELSVLPKLLSSPASEQGFYIMPSYTGALLRLGSQSSKSVRDRVYMSQEEWEKFSLMNCFCAKAGRRSTLCVVDKGDFFAWVDAELNQGGENRIYASFGVRHEFGEVLPQDEKTLLLKDCAGADYPAMALAFRDYLLKRRGLFSLKERMRGNPVLGYSAEAMRTKIFMGCKSPSVPDGSSPLNCCANFEEAGVIVDEMKKSGIDKAVVTLVGWNLGGHDGAYPQRFPVEPSFGGEEGLKRLIAKTKSLGYQIVPHDNVTDVYLNSASFDYESVSRDEHGLPQSAGLWSGGQSFKSCPTVYMDRFAGDFKRIQGLGFEGSYYLDAQGTGLWRCHDPKHPADERQFAMSLARILQHPRELFGAVSCEVGPVYTLPFVDEIAHLHGQGTFEQFKGRLNPDYAAAVERVVPFYNIAVHGIVLYQGSWIHCLRGKPDGVKRGMLAQLALGARPSMEVSFRALGNGDEYKGSIRDVKEPYEIAFGLMKGVHCELLDSFQDLGGNGEWKASYQDGTTVEVSLERLSGKISKGGKTLREI